MTEGQVVRRIRPSDDAPAEAGAGEAVHVLFNILGSRRLSLPDIASPYAGAVYLGHRILENPSDFRSHVQRILLLTDRGDEIDLQGALVDLYIALGDKGEGLKRRLLELAAPRLSRTALAFLRQRLASGLKPWEAAVSRMRSSLLSLGFSGVHEVVGRREASSTSGGYANAVEEARACLEYGQVDEAREVLERALRQDPGNDLIAAELMEIYQYTRDDERLAVMRQFLLDAAPSEPTDLREESPNASQMPEVSGARRSWVAQPNDAQASL